MGRPRSTRRRRIFRALAAVVLVTAGSIILTLTRTRPGSEVPSQGAGTSGITRELEREIPPDHPRITFIDRAAALGVDAVHGSGRRTSLLPEDMGSGAALEDLDGDGDLDLFLVNLAGPIGPGDATSVAPPTTGGTHRLYRNDGGLLVEVSTEAGVALRDHGMGVACGDVDGDGLLDLYLTCYGRNRLLRNLGGLHFEEITERAGVDDRGFGAGAAFADVDRDGDLDLYLCNYVEFRWDGQPPAESEWGGYALPYTINPSSFPPAPNRFYRNRGDGTFVEEAQQLGISDPSGRSLAATFADFNGDGWPDLYVLNDVSKNAYFENRGDGTFVDRSIESLAADYRGAMGNAVADIEGDGDLDLFITHWIAQENGCYLNLRRELSREEALPPTATFMDQADLLGLGQVSLDYVGWGTALFDYDLDGPPDLVVVNGSTMEAEEDPTRLQAQRPLLFWQRRGAGFFEVGAVAGAPWQASWNARGLVEGDLDGDGDLDLVVTENRGPVHLLVNQGSQNHWLRVRLRQPSGNRYGVGAQVRVETGSFSALQEVGAGTSYLCHRPLELTFGLGAAEQASRVEVRWPDGTVTSLNAVAGDRVVILGPDGEVKHEGR